MTKYRIKKGGYINTTRFDDINLLLEKSYYNDDNTLMPFDNLHMSIDDFQKLTKQYAQYINPQKYIGKNRLIDESHIIIKGISNKPLKTFLIMDNQEIKEYNPSELYLKDITNPFIFFEQNKYKGPFYNDHIEAQMLIRMKKLNIFQNNGTILEKYYSNFFNHEHAPTILFNPFYIMLNCNMLYEYNLLCNDINLYKEIINLKFNTLPIDKISSAIANEYKNISTQIINLIGSLNNINNAVSSFRFTSHSNNIIYQVKKNNIANYLNILHDLYYKENIANTDDIINFFNNYKDSLTGNYKEDYAYILTSCKIHIAKNVFGHTIDYLIKNVSRKESILLKNYNDKNTFLNFVMEIVLKQYASNMLLIRNIQLQELLSDNISLTKCILNNNTIDCANILAESIAIKLNTQQSIINNELILLANNINIEEDISILNKQIEDINKEILKPKEDYTNYFLYNLIKLLKERSNIKKLYPKFNFENLIDHMYMIRLMNNKNLSISNTRILSTFYSKIKKEYNMNKELNDYIKNYIVKQTKEYVPFPHKTPFGAPDCFENAIRNFINTFIYYEGIFEHNLLPKNTLEYVKQFYIKYNIYEKQLTDKCHEDWFKLINDHIVEKLRTKVEHDIGHSNTIFNSEGNIKKKDMKASIYFFVIILGIIFDINYDYVTTDIISIRTFLENFFQTGLFKKDVSIVFKKNTKIEELIEMPIEFSNTTTLIYDSYILNIQHGHCFFETNEIEKIPFEYNIFENLIHVYNLELNFLPYYYHPIQFFKKDFSKDDINIILHIANTENFNYKTLTSFEFKELYITFFQTSKATGKKEFIMKKTLIRNFQKSNFIMTKFLAYLYYYYADSEIKIKYDNDKKNTILKMENNVRECSYSLIENFKNIFEPMIITKVQLAYMIIYYLKNKKDIIVEKLKTFINYISDEGCSFENLEFIENIHLKFETKIYMLFTCIGINKNKYAIKNKIILDIIKNNLFEKYINILDSMNYTHIKNEIITMLLLECTIDDITLLENYNDANEINIIIDNILKTLQKYNIKLGYLFVENNLAEIIDLYIKKRKKDFTTIIDYIFTSNNYTLLEKKNYFENVQQFDNDIINIYSPLNCLNNKNIQFDEIINSIDMSQNNIGLINEICTSNIKKTDLCRYNTFYIITFFLATNEYSNKYEYIYTILKNMYNESDRDIDYEKCINITGNTNLVHKDYMIKVLMKIISNLETIKINKIIINIEILESIITNYYENEELYDHEKLCELLIKNILNKKCNIINIKELKDKCIVFFKNNFRTRVLFILHILKQNKDKSKIAINNSTITDYILNINKLVILLNVVSDDNNIINQIRELSKKKKKL